MFEVHLEKASSFKRIIDSISSLVDEVNFDCTPSGITLQALDMAHVSLVSLLIRQDGFDKYRCDRSMTLGINLQSLTKILKCARNEDSLTLKAEDSGDYLDITFEHKRKESEFQLKLMEIDLEKLSIPDSTYSATVQMPSLEFQRIISSLQTLGDSVTISVSSGSIKFSVLGDLKGTMTINSGSDIDGTATTIICNDELTLTFAMRYLNYFTKATGLSSTVILSLSPDVPLVVEYQIENGSSTGIKKEGEDKKMNGKCKNGHIRYYLAPKIDEE